MNEYSEHNLEAIYLAKEINLLKAADKLDKNLIGRRREFLTYLLENKSFLFIFTFGAAVFVNVSKDEQAAIRRQLGKFLVNPVKKNYADNYKLKESERKLNIGEGIADMPIVSQGEIEIAARILAQSVALEYIEDLTDEILLNIESMNASLEKEGRFLKDTKTILKLSGQNNNIIQFVISKLALLDKPDITWNNQRLEAYFSQLADIFDLRQRFRNIEYKIGFVKDNSEFALGAIQASRANFLELVIVILIAIDIVIYFWG